MNLVDSLRDELDDPLERELDGSLRREVGDSLERLREVGGMMSCAKFRGKRSIIIKNRSVRQTKSRNWLF